MSSSVAVMRDGIIEQVGTPEESYDYPRTRFVAAFLGSANLLEARVISVGSDGKEHGVERLRFEVATDWDAPITALGRVQFAAGGRVIVAVRPEGVRLVPRRDDRASDTWAGVVETVQFLGDAVEYRVRVRDRILRARCDRSQQFAVGDAVVIELRSQACTVVAD
jgi:ABC-type Fe3+/spermidine/putrescine transport system ATPase subunit